jgi:hypothetical protein
VARQAVKEYHYYRLGFLASWSYRAGFQCYPRYYLHHYYRRRYSRRQSFPRRYLC